MRPSTPPIPVAYAFTKDEAEEKATHYIKPGHSVIKEERGFHRGKEYNFVICVK